MQGNLNSLSVLLLAICHICYAAEDSLNHIHHTNAYNTESNSGGSHQKPTSTGVILLICAVFVVIMFLYLVYSLICTNNSHIFVDVTAGKALAARQQRQQQREEEQDEEMGSVDAAVHEPLI